MTEQISDYDKYGYDYERYWQDANINRTYEDRSERAALAKLLPPQIDWLCDLGAGFGRLFDTYAKRTKQIILLDYSLENLTKARTKINTLQSSAKVYFIAANVYHLPLNSATLDCVLAVRLFHHLKKPALVLNEISRVLKPRGKLVVEYANKKHFFEVVRAILGRSKMQPFALKPHQRGNDIFYNFHPKYIRLKLDAAQLKVKREISVSNLRHNFFKKVLGAKIMLALEKIFQPAFSAIKFGPSIFVLAEKDGARVPIYPTNLDQLLSCPKCGAGNLAFAPSNIHCPKCQKDYPLVDGIYDMRVV